MSATIFYFLDLKNFSSGKKCIVIRLWKKGKSRRKNGKSLKEAAAVSSIGPATLSERIVSIDTLKA